MTENQRTVKAESEPFTELRYCYKTNKRPIHEKSTNTFEKVLKNNSKLETKPSDLWKIIIKSSLDGHFLQIGPNKQLGPQLKLSGPTLLST